MVLGEGAASSFACEIKLNTRSSTETELVSVDAYVPEVLYGPCILYLHKVMG